MHEDGRARIPFRLDADLEAEGPGSCVDTKAVAPNLRKIESGVIDGGREGIESVRGWPR